MATKKKTTKKEVIKKPTPKTTKSSKGKIPTAKSSSFALTALPIRRYSDPLVKNIKNHRKAYLIGVIVVGLLLALIVPHLFVAFVDGRPITAWDYYSTLDKKYGSDIKQQLITQQLVESEAAKRGVKVTDADVQAKYSDVENQASGSAQLDQLLQQQGLTQSEFKEQIKLQLLVQKMFGSDASVSAKEVDDYIQQNQSNLPEVDDTVRSQIEDQLKQQKIVQAFQDWLQQAQNSNRVKKL